MRSCNRCLFLLEPSHVGNSVCRRWWCRRDIASHSYESLRPRGEEPQSGCGRDLEEILGRRKGPCIVQRWRRASLSDQFGVGGRDRCRRRRVGCCIFCGRMRILIRHVGFSQLLSYTAQCLRLLPAKGTTKQIQRLLLEKLASSSYLDRKSFSGWEESGSRAAVLLAWNLGCPRAQLRARVIVATGPLEGGQGWVDASQRNTYSLGKRILRNLRSKSFETITRTGSRYRSLILRLL